MSKKRKTFIDFGLVVNPKYEREYTTYICFISELVNKGEKIPTRVLKRLFSFLESTEKSDVILRLRKILSNKTYGLLKNTSYDFKIKKRMPMYNIPNKNGSKKVNHHYYQIFSLQELLENIYGQILNNENYKVIIKSVEKTTLLIYPVIKEYIDEIKGKSPLTKYGICVLIGYILSQFKLTLIKDEFNERNYKCGYHKYLYDTVILHIKKI